MQKNHKKAPWDVKKREHPRTAVPAGSVFPPLLDSPLDKTERQIVHEPYTIRRPVSLYVSASVGTCPPTPTESIFVCGRFTGSYRLIS